MTPSDRIKQLAGVVPTEGTSPAERLVVATLAYLDEQAADRPLPPPLVLGGFGAPGYGPQPAPEPQYGHAFPGRLPPSPAPASPPGEEDKPDDCHCATCSPPPMINGWMVCCSLCGNKRCPHADNHRNVCTSSNALNQTPVVWAQELADTRNNRDDWMARAEAEGGKLREALAELTRLKAENARLETLNGDLRRKWVTLDQHSDALTKLEAAQRTIASLEAETMTLTSERDTARMGQGELKEQLTRWQVRSDRFMGQVRELEAVVKAARTVYAASRYWGPSIAPSVMLANLRTALSALDQPSQPEPASEPEAPREIKVGGKWLDSSLLGPSHSVTVEKLHDDGGGVNLLKDTGWRFSMTTIAFRHAYRWLSDPPASETAEGGEK